MPFDVSRLQLAATPIELIDGHPVRPGEVLVEANATDRERSSLRNTPARPFQPDDQDDWRSKFPEPSVTVIGGLRNAGFELWTGLSNDKAAALASDPNLPGIRHNTVYFGAGSLDFHHGGPGSLPVAARGNRVLPPSGTEGEGDLAILDTGLPPEWQAHPGKLRGVRGIDAVQSDIDRLDEDDDDELDIQAGHGFFICGLVRRSAPDVAIDMYRVLHSTGEGDEATIIATLNNVLHTDARVVSLSFGAFPAENEPEPPLVQVIRELRKEGKIVVAAAGNVQHRAEYRDRTMFPASMPEVTAVGAYDSRNGGRSLWPNSNPADEYAPGVELVSTYAGWSGRHLPDDNVWAKWSGTSFATPVVAARLAQQGRGAGVEERPWPTKRTWPQSRVPEFVVQREVAFRYDSDVDLTK